VKHNDAETLSEIQTESAHSEAGDLASEFDDKNLDSGRTKQNKTGTTSGLVNSARTQPNEATEQKSTSKPSRPNAQEEVKQERAAGFKVPSLNLD
jgi:hypothetical protein